MKIRELRLKTGLSRFAFATTYEIPPRTLERWEQERSDPPSWYMILLERCVNEDIDKGLFEGYNKRV